jgi:hypothetical protein
VEHRAGRKAKIQLNGGNLWVEKEHFLTGKRKFNLEWDPDEFFE